MLGLLKDNRMFKAKPSAYFMLCSFLFFGHILLSVWVAQEGFLIHGRTLLLFAGCLYVFSYRDFWPFQVRLSSFSRGLLLVILCVFITFVPLGISFSFGRVSFTYGNNGLDTEFMSSLSYLVVYFFVTTFLGTEIIFRRLAFRALSPEGRHDLLANVIQSVLFCFWILPGLVPFLRNGELWPVFVFLLMEFLKAITAGFLFLLFNNLLLSGTFISVTGVFSYYVLNDYDLGLNSPFYFVTSSFLYYGLALAIHLLLVGGLCFMWKKGKTIHGNA